MITHQTRIVAIIALLFVLSMAALLWLIISKITVEGTALTERVETIADNNAKMKVYRDLQRLVDETEEHRESIGLFVLSEDKTSEFLTDIESLEKSQGVELTTNSLNVTTKEGVFDELVIEFLVKGNEEGVKKMMRIFETLPYHSKVTSLMFTKEEGGEWSGDLELSVTLLKDI